MRSFRSAESLHHHLRLSQQQHADPLTIIFTSGSTGVPKGVVLSQGNVASNVDGINEVIHLNQQDTVLGVLPFFHSFGFTVTLWTAMTLPCAAAYHFSPLEARPIGKLAQEFGATVLLATPTFLRAYLRRVEPEQFSKLDVVVVGAEKMPIALADEFEKKFGVRPVEGYGTTELSPVVCVNIPPTRATQRGQLGLREGSVGKPFSGIEARVVSFDDDSVLDTGATGLLEIRGPNVMLGYLNQPELTTQAMHDDWYRTGDVAVIDAEGFIHITGRLSRFSKIGGEMIPHIQIEEVLTDILGTGEEGALRVAVTSAADEKRGEKLIVLHTHLDVSEIGHLKAHERCRPAQSVPARRGLLCRGRCHSDTRQRQTGSETHATDRRRASAVMATLGLAVSRFRFDGQRVQAVDKAHQRLVAIRLLQLADGLAFNLPHALASYRKDATDFFERIGISIG